MEAKVFTSGNLGNDAKVINFENGNSVITFSIATNSNTPKAMVNKFRQPPGMIARSLSSKSMRN